MVCGWGAGDRQGEKAREKSVRKAGGMWEECVSQGVRKVPRRGGGILFCRFQRGLRDSIVSGIHTEKYVVKFASTNVCSPPYLGKDVCQIYLTVAGRAKVEGFGRAKVEDF